MLLLIDASNAAHRVFNAVEPLFTSYGRVTTITFGLLRLVRHVLSQFNPDNYVIVWDGGRSKRRMELYPEYKAQRDKDRQETPESKERFFDYINQVRSVRELLDLIGAPQVFIKGAEADDIIAQLAGYGSNDCTIVSTDKDFWQLVTDGCSCYDPVKNKTVDAANFAQVTGFTGPEAYFQFKCMVGDSSDGIGGIPGVGEKTAKQVLEQYGHVTNILEDETDLPRRIRLVIDNLDIFVRNLEMMTLHLQPDPIVARMIPGLLPAPYNVQELEQTFKDLEFFSILEGMGKFMAPFNKALLRSGGINNGHRSRESQAGRTA